MTWPLRAVAKIERHEDRPGATLTLTCGHKQYLADFPEGTPPPCFRRECYEAGCERFKARIVQ